MRSAPQGLARIAAASTILNARNAAKAAGRMPGHDTVVLPTDVVRLIVETRQQTEQAALPVKSPDQQIDR